MLRFTHKKYRNWLDPEAGSGGQQVKVDDF
jgi:hypothetical protein